MSKKYNLNISEFDVIVNDYVKSLGEDFSLDKNETKDQIIYRFARKGQRKAKSILTCYNSLGRISFSFGGIDASIAITLSKLLIENTEIKIGDKKSFTIKAATRDEVDTIIEFMDKDCGCKIEYVKSDTPAIIIGARILGKLRDIITLTYYQTGTLLVQGRASVTFLNFITIASELFNSSEVKKEHLKLFDVSESDEMINSDLSSYLPNAYKHIGPKLDAIMAPSLILLNSPKEMPDYSALAFPVLRGAEGILKKIFLVEGVIITDNFGEYFRTDYSTNTINWTKDCSSLFPNIDFRNSLLCLYQFFHKQRHSIFHIDETIEGSRTLSYEQAFEVVTEGLRLMNEVYKYPH